MSKRKSMAPRNPFVAAARFKKAGAHGKTEKAMRRTQKIHLQGSVAQLAQSKGLLPSRLSVQVRPGPLAA